MRSKDITYVNLTLEGDAWHPSIGTDVESTTRWLGYTLEARQARGAAEWLAYTHSEEPRGWHAIARHTVTVRPLTPNTLLLMLGWLPEYDLTAPEHVYVSVPFWATLKNLSALPSRANFTIEVSTPRVHVSGELAISHVAEAALRSRPHVMHVALEECDWTVDAGTPGSVAYLALSEALDGPNDVGATPGESGWMLAANGRLVPRRLNATHLVLFVPPLAAYDIASPETITLSVPASALLQHHEDLISVASFVVVPEPGTARLRGELLRLNGTHRARGTSLLARSLEVELVGDTFVAELAHNASLQRALLQARRPLRACAAARHCLSCFTPPLSNPSTFSRPPPLCAGRDLGSGGAARLERARLTRSAPRREPERPGARRRQL